LSEFADRPRPLRPSSEPSVKKACFFKPASLIIDGGHALSRHLNLRQCPSLKKNLMNQQLDFLFCPDRQSALPSGYPLEFRQRAHHSFAFATDDAAGQVISGKSNFIRKGVRSEARGRLVKPDAALRSRRKVHAKLRAGKKATTEDQTTDQKYPQMRRTHPAN
jgi:hypothetical protein